jgi:hypothetical protein
VEDEGPDDPAWDVACEQKGGEKIAVKQHAANAMSVPGQPMFAAPNLTVQPPPRPPRSAVRHVPLAEQVEPPMLKALKSSVHGQDNFIRSFIRPKSKPLLWGRRHPLSVVQEREASARQQSLRQLLEASLIEFREFGSDPDLAHAEALASSSLSSPSVAAAATAALSMHVPLRWLNFGPPQTETPEPDIARLANSLCSEVEIVLQQQLMVSFIGMIIHGLPHSFVSFFCTPRFQLSMRRGLLI